VRGDLLHPVVSGNKLFKLIPIVQKATSSGCNTLISVGGRFSNHLHALAWVGNELGLSTVGIVQGYLEQEETPTLADCRRWGMTIHFVDRITFQKRYSYDFWKSWLEHYPRAFRVNEGGWSSEAIHGSGMWWEGIPEETDIVVTPIGSGSTYAGLSKSSSKHCSVVGVPVYKDPDGYSDLKLKLLETGINESDIQLWTGYSGKGFGRLDSRISTFKVNFELTTGVMLDPVYTAKSFFALSDKLEHDSALGQKKIAILHTGGLQGSRP
jgi:1-aminocyclopropane-1-carboxylate deaminase